MSPTVCETLHCRGSGLLVAGPDKSLWSLMFVSDRGWVHNRLGAKRHDIHLSCYRLLKQSGLLPLPHARSTQLRRISQSSHALLFFLLRCHALRKGLQSSILTKCCVKCLQMTFSTDCTNYQMPGTILRERTHQCART